MLGYLIDLDSVIDRGGELAPGADRFVNGLREANIPFLLLDAGARHRRPDDVSRLRRLGMDVTPDHIFHRAAAPGRSGAPRNRQDAPNREPGLPILQAAREELALPTDQTVVISETVEAAILGGVRLDFKTILVLGGTTRAEDLSRYTHQPDKVVSSLNDLDPIRLEEELNAAEGDQPDPQADPVHHPSHRQRRRPLAATSF